MPVMLTCGAVEAESWTRGESARFSMACQEAFFVEQVKFASIDGRGGRPDVPDVVACRQDSMVPVDRRLHTGPRFESRGCGVGRSARKELDRHGQWREG